MKEKILAILGTAFEEIRPVLFVDTKFSPELILTGSNGCMDSMALVSYITAVEELLAEETGNEIRLVNDRTFSKGNSPFYSVETMRIFIEEIMGEIH